MQPTTLSYLAVPSRRRQCILQQQQQQQQRLAAPRHHTGPVPSRPFHIDPPVWKQFTGSAVGQRRARPLTLSGGRHWTPVHRPGPARPGPPWSASIVGVCWWDETELDVRLVCLLPRRPLHATHRRAVARWRHINVELVGCRPSQQCCNVFYSEFRHFQRFKRLHLQIFLRFIRTFYYGRTPRYSESERCIMFANDFFYFRQIFWRHSCSILESFPYGDPSSSAVNGT